MAQYWTYSEGQYQYKTLASGLKTRRGQRGKRFVIDIELQVGGFSLAEDVGWQNTGGFDDVIAGAKAREGVRIRTEVTAEWCVDIEDTPTGFGGVENIDWHWIGGGF